MSRLPARELALSALLDRQGMVTRHVDRLLEAGAASHEDTALAIELAYGVVRRQATLDAVVRAYSKRPEDHVPFLLRQIVRLGLYQLIFLERVPDFAAVNEAVEQCRHRLPHATGFVNALLRAVARGASEVEQGPPPFTREAVPLTLDRFRRLDNPVFAPAADLPETYLAEACSLPEELARRWLRRFAPRRRSGSSGDGEAVLRRAFALAMAANARPPVIARVNAARGSVADVLAGLAAAGVQATAHENGRSIVLPRGVNVAGLEAFRTGLITPQDATATEAAIALDARPGQRVLDFCAAPGTKTTHLGELMGGGGDILAVDVDRGKLNLVEEAARRCGLANVRTHLAEQVGSLEPGSFDRVLVDAPCSNTGVLARRVEARWRFRDDELRRTVVDQGHILALASMFLAPGGRLVYSTCSIEPEEDELLVQAFLRKNGRFRLAEERPTLPSGEVAPERYHDGGYWAALTVR